MSEYTIENNNTRDKNDKLYKVRVIDESDVVLAMARQGNSAEVLHNLNEKRLQPLVNKSGMAN